jgi:hypothetical protein
MLIRFVCLLTVRVLGRLALLARGDAAKDQRARPAGALTVHPVGGAATYAFRVTPTLGTRYQVKLFQTAPRPARWPSPQST